RGPLCYLHSFPTRRSSDLVFENEQVRYRELRLEQTRDDGARVTSAASPIRLQSTPPSYDLPPPRMGQHTDEILDALLGLSAEKRSEEHTSELQSRFDLVCR